MKKIYLMLVLLMVTGCFAIAQTTYYSKATATNFNDVNSWGTAADGTGTSPATISNADNFVIQNNAILNLTGNASVRMLTLTTGSLTIAANALTVQIGTVNNATFSMAGGTLNVTGGTLKVMGNFACTSAAILNQSGGEIIVDGNNGGATVGSVASGTAIVNYAPGTNTNINLTGGTFTIVDPHVAASETFSANIPTIGATAATGTHTFKFGDGISTDTGSAAGFRFYSWAGSGIFKFQNVIIDAGSAANRFVGLGSSSTYYNFVVAGNMTITANSEYRNVNTSTTTGATYVAGNIVNNGTFVNLGAVVFANATSTSSTAIGVSPATIAQTVSGTGIFKNAVSSPTANFVGVIINNTSNGGVTFAGQSNITAQPANSVSVSGTLTFTAGRVFTSGNAPFILGIATPAVGTLSYTSGGFGSGTTFGRWFAATTTGSSFTAGTDVTSVTTQYPFASSSNVNRHAWINATTPTAGGIIAVTFNQNSGNTSFAAIADGTGSVDIKANDTWAVSTLSGNPAAASYGLQIVAPNIMGSALLNASTRLIKSNNTFVGTHQAGTVTPGAQRVALAVADLFGSTFQMAALNADMPFISVANGNYNAASTWNKGTVPTCGDVVAIANGTTVTINSAGNVCKNISVLTGGTLTSVSGDLTVGCTDNNAAFTISGGTYNMNGGTLNLNGKFVLDGTSTGVFAQTAGAIVVDGNSGTLATSTPSHIVDMYCFSTSTIQLTGGTFTIVDPPAATSSGAHAFKIYPSVGNAGAASAWTLNLGNGVSTTEAGYAGAGFLIQLAGPTTANVYQLGNVVVNNPGNFVNRRVTSTNNISLNNLTITDGTWQTTSNLYVAGNLVNNDTFINAANTLHFANYTGGASTASTVAQSIGGTGVWTNNATWASKTAELSSLTVNNSNATGLTLNVPLSLSGTLTMTSGLINTTNTNLLQLGTATAAGTLSGTTSATNMVVGPFARTFASSRTASGTYTVATLFPIGKGTNSLPIYLDPTTASTGAVTLKAEAFATNTGTGAAGVTNLSSKTWATSFQSGQANFTNAFVRVGDAAITASNKLLHSATLNGVYGGAPVVTSATAGSNITTAAAILSASWLGNFAYGDLTPCATPTTQPTNFVVSNLTNTTLTGTFTAATTTPTGYLVVRYPSGATVTNPVDGTAYAAAVTLGAGTVVGNYTAAPFTFNQTGLTASTTYDYYVYSFNNGTCSGPAYYTVSPLTQSVTTCAAATGAPGTPTASAVLTNGFTATWAASSTAGATYEVDVATNSTFTTFVTGYQAYNNGTSNTINITGLTPATTYYVRVRAKNLTCYSTVSGTLTRVTACNPIATFPWTENFDSYTFSYSNSTANLPSVCWGTAGSTTYPFTLSNAASNTYNDPSGGTGNYLTVYYNNGTKTFVYTPAMTLNAGTSYSFKFDYVGDGLAGSYVTAVVNNAQTTTGSTLLGTVVNGLTTTGGSNSATFTNYTYTFTPTTTGTYYFGLTDSSTSAPFYLGFDNFEVSLTPTPTITTVTSSEVCATSTKVVITGNNLLGMTTATIGGVSLLPFDTVTATRLVKFVTTPFSGTTTLTNNVGTATNSTALTFAIAPTITLSAATQANCAGANSSVLTTVTSPAANYTSYTWSPSTGVSGTQAAGWTFNPTANTSYVLTATNSTTGCHNTTTKTVVVNPAPSNVAVSPTTSTMLCGDPAIQLAATGGTIKNSVTVGTGTSSNGTTSFPSPLTNYYGGTKHQMLITVAELSALGLTAGAVIDSIGFNVTAVGTTFTGTLNSFQVDMANTAATALTSTSFVASLTNVRPAANLVVPTTSLPQNLLIPITPFTWNGTSNLLIQTSYSNANSGTSTDYVTMTQSTTSYTSCNWYRSDGESPATVFAATTPTSSASTRPNVILKTSLATSISWTPTAGLFTDATATTAYTGGNANTVYAAPSSTATYLATSTSGSGCSNTNTTGASATITVTPLTINLGNDTTICAGSSLTLDAGASNSSLTKLWNTTATTQTIAVTTAGSYNVTVTNGTCSKSDTIAVAVSNLPVVDLGVDTAICAGTTLTLDAGAANATYAKLWSNNDTTLTIDVNAAGTYYVTVTNENGCSNSDTIAVTENPLPIVTGIDVTGTSPVFNFAGQGAQNATSYTWNYGDGSPDVNTTVSTSSYTYPTPAANTTYTVTLIATNDCGSDTATVNVEVKGTSIRGFNLDANALKVYPNPAMNLVNIENLSNSKMKNVIVTNVLGQQVIKIPVTNNKQQTLDVSSLNSGLYNVQIEFEEGIVVRKLEVLK